MPVTKLRTAKRNCGLVKKVNQFGKEDGHGDTHTVRKMFISKDTFSDGKFHTYVALNYLRLEC